MNQLDLPVEVLLRIFRFLTPCEIIRLRQVCQQFHDITHDSVLWRETYTEICLLRPPGPFPWQSTQYLERALVKSEVLSKTWTSRPLKPLSCMSTRLEWRNDLVWTALFGRWCLYLEERTIMCHDIDTDTHQVLYKNLESFKFWFTATSASDGDGQRMFLLLADFMYPHQFVKLFEFTVNDNVFSGPKVIDLSDIGSPSPNVWQLTRTHHHCHGTTPFLPLQLENSCVVFDLHTRSLFRLPTFSADQDEFRSLPPPATMFTQLVLTKTHIIAVRTYSVYLASPVVIQAFTIPETTCPRDGHGIADLRLTNQAVIPLKPQHFTFLRNSRVDPITKTTGIRLLYSNDRIPSMGSQNHMSCIDLTLPDVSSGDIQPIHVQEKRLFESMWYLQRYTASDDGHVRGFLMSDQLDGTAIRKFTIDASGEECEAVLGDPSSICGVLDGITGHITFDGFLGRIHYFMRAHHGPTTCPEVVSVEIN